MGELRMERWSTRFGFLLATIGSAVGIGNIWRFPSVVGQNGGGAYLVPYLLAVFGFGLPLMTLELAIGRYLRADVVSAFRRIGSKFHFFGWLVWVIVFYILSYYLVITGWTLAYAIASLVGVKILFSSFTSSCQPILYFTAATVATGLVVSLGIRGGIERVTSILMPINFIILGGMTLFSTSLSGFTNGLNYFLKPDFTALHNPLIWSAAFGQAFFSLSVGFGVLITYGAYLDNDTAIPSSSLIITIADLAISILAGIVIFPIVFTFGMEPAIGAELAFSTLPRAFEHIPSGRILAGGFFLLLFFAALTSSVSMMEVNVAAVISSTDLSRRKLTLILTVMVFLLGLPSALSYSSINLHMFGFRVLDLLDETVGTIGLPINALLIAVIFTWFLDKRALSSQMRSSWGDLHPLTVYMITKYVVPAVLIIITVSRLFLGLDFPEWHFLPGIPYIGSLAQELFTLLLVGLPLTILILLIQLDYRYRHHRRLKQFS
ncbi:MAG: sodium-dependent transporter [Candidatus Bathyarchaeia archaeon]